jgi:hypothetical protein
VRFPWRETLLRADVEALLSKGHRWTVEYCAGGDLPPRTGLGFAGFPNGVLGHIPTPAAARKLVRRKSSKTYFYARLDTDHDGPVLRLEER